MGRGVVVVRGLGCWGGVSVCGVWGFLGGCVLCGLWVFGVVGGLLVLGGRVWV
jgi:hypothetical protein